MVILTYHQNGGWQLISKFINQVLSVVKLILLHYLLQIDEDAQRNMKVKLFPKIRLPHENTGYFEGYFRMFTPEGFPFGNVFHMTDLIPHY